MSPFSFVARRHLPGVAAIAAFAVGTSVWIWVTQDTSAAFDVFAGWRQIVIVACTGIVFGGIAAESFALAAWSSPGETPVGSTIIGAVIALPFYALSILFSLPAID